MRAAGETREKPGTFPSAVSDIVPDQLNADGGRKASVRTASCGKVIDGGRSRWANVLGELVSRGSVQINRTGFTVPLLRSIDREESHLFKIEKKRLYAIRHDTRDKKDKRIPSAGECLRTLDMHQQYHSFPSHLESSTSLRRMVINYSLTSGWPSSIGRTQPGAMSVSAVMRVPLTANRTRKDVSAVQHCHFAQLHHYTWHTR